MLFFVLFRFLFLCVSSRVQTPARRLSFTARRAGTVGKNVGKVSPGGVEFVAFNIDPDFALCIDGLIVVDIEQLKESRRQRYLG